MEGEKIKVEFNEINDLNQNYYELRIIISCGTRELGAIPYVTNQEKIAGSMAKDISNILESKGFGEKNQQIEIKKLNLNGKVQLLNLLIPERLKEGLSKLNYTVDLIN